MFLTQYLQVKANLLCYNATISAAEKSARWRRAIDMLDIGVWSAIRLDVISFNAAMSACNSDGWKDALQVFKDLKARRLEVDVISFNSAISACEKSQRWRQALSLLEEALQISLLFTTLAGIMAVSNPVSLPSFTRVNQVYLSRTNYVNQINTTSSSKVLLVLPSLTTLASVLVALVEPGFGHFGFFGRWRCKEPGSWGRSYRWFYYSDAVMSVV